MLYVIPEKSTAERLYYQIGKLSIPKATNRKPDVLIVAQPDEDAAEVGVQGAKPGVGGIAFRNTPPVTAFGNTVE